MVSTPLKNMLVKMGSSSPNRGENKKSLKPPPRPLLDVDFNGITMDHQCFSKENPPRKFTSKPGTCHYTTPACTEAEKCHGPSLSTVVHGSGPFLVSKLAAKVWWKQQFLALALLGNDAIHMTTIWQSQRKTSK